MVHVSICDVVVEEKRLQYVVIGVWVIGVTGQGLAVAMLRDLICGATITILCSASNDSTKLQIDLNALCNYCSNQLSQLLL